MDKKKAEKKKENTGVQHFSLVFPVCNKFHFPKALKKQTALFATGFNIKTKHLKILYIDQVLCTQTSTKI